MRSVQPVPLCIKSLALSSRSVSRWRFAVAALSVLSVCSLAANASAETFVWKGRVLIGGTTFFPGGGVWNSGIKWNDGFEIGDPFPNAAGDIAVIRDAFPFDSTFTLNQNITIQSLSVADNEPFPGSGQLLTISSGVGANTLTFQSATAGGGTLLDVTSSGNSSNQSNIVRITAPIVLGGTSPLTITNNDNAAAGANRGQNLHILGGIAGNGNALTVGGSINFPNQVVIQGGISGDGTSLTKTGDFDLLLGSATTYTGKTTIAGGDLVLFATGSLPMTEEIVFSGDGFLNANALSGGFVLGPAQTISGTGNGITASSITVEGRVSPGGTGATGGLPLSGDVFFGTTAVAQFEFMSPDFDVLPLSGFDRIHGLGGGDPSIAFDGALQLAFSGGPYPNGSSVQIFRDYFSYSGEFDTVTFSGLAPNQAAIFDPTNGVVTIVPEPASGVLLMVGVAGLAALARRRNRCCAN